MVVDVDGRHRISTEDLSVSAAELREVGREIATLVAPSDANKHTLNTVAACIAEFIRNTMRGSESHVYVNYYPEAHEAIIMAVNPDTESALPHDEADDLVSGDAETIVCDRLKHSVCAGIGTSFVAGLNCEAYGYAVYKISGTAYSYLRLSEKSFDLSAHNPTAH